MKLLDAFSHARQEGVTPNGLHILMVLIDDSPLMATELARRTRTSVANITGHLDRLERDGWLVRTRSTTDRRVWSITPTERAFEIFTSHLEATP